MKAIQFNTQNILKVKGLLADLALIIAQSNKAKVCPIKFMTSGKCMTETEAENLLGMYCFAIGVNRDN